MKLRAVALVSGVYDFLLGLPMLLAPVAVARAFGAPAPSPVVNAQVNGVFALGIALGYFWVVARREPAALRGYLWIAGVFVKGLGAGVFLLDHFVHGSPASFLLFAATDGALAAVTLALLVRDGRRPGPAA